MASYNISPMFWEVLNKYWANKNFLRGLKFARLTNIYKECGVIALSEVRSAACYIAGSDGKKRSREVQTLISLLADYFEKDPAEMFIEDELNKGGSSDE